MSAQQLITTEPRIDELPATTERIARRPSTARVQLAFRPSDRRQLRNLIDDCNAVVDPKADGGH